MNPEDKGGIKLLNVTKRLQNLQILKVHESINPDKTCSEIEIM